MTKILFSAALAAAVLAPQAASAQTIPAAIVAVVDAQRIYAECNACRTAKTSLEAQVAAARSLQTSLGTSLQTEQNSLQTAVEALKGKQPDAALAARIKSFQTRQQSAQQQLGQRQESIQASQQYVLQQINTKLSPAIQQVMARRGANLVLDVNATVQAGPALDITNDVLAAVNASLTSLSTTAPVAAPTQSR